MKPEPGKIQNTNPVNARNRFIGQKQVPIRTSAAYGMQLANAVDFRE
jgi:hypothetical protein